MAETAKKKRGASPRGFSNGEKGRSQRSGGRENSDIRVTERGSGRQRERNKEQISFAIVD